MLADIYPDHAIVLHRRRLTDLDNEISEPVYLVVVEEKASLRLCLRGILDLTNSRREPDSSTPDNGRLRRLYLTGHSIATRPLTCGNCRCQSTSDGLPVALL